MINFIAWLVILSKTKLFGLFKPFEPFRGHKSVANSDQLDGRVRRAGRRTKEDGSSENIFEIEHGHCDIDRSDGSDDGRCGGPEFACWCKA